VEHVWLALSGLLVVTVWLWALLYRQHQEQRRIMEEIISSMSRNNLQLHQGIRRLEHLRQQLDDIDINGPRPS